MISSMSQNLNILSIDTQFPQIVLFKYETTILIKRSIHVFLHNKQN